MCVPVGKAVLCVHEVRLTNNMYALLFLMQDCRSGLVLCMGCVQEGSVRNPRRVGGVWWRHPCQHGRCTLHMRSDSVPALSCCTSVHAWAFQPWDALPSSDERSQTTCASSRLMCCCQAGLVVPQLCTVAQVRSCQAGSDRAVPQPSDPMQAPRANPCSLRNLIGCRL